MKIEIDARELGLVDEDGDFTALKDEIVYAAAQQIYGDFAINFKSCLKDEMYDKGVKLIEKNIPYIIKDISDKISRKRKLADLCATDKENRDYIEWLIEEVFKHKMKTYVTEIVEEVLKKKLGMKE